LKTKHGGILKGELFFHTDLYGRSYLLDTQLYKLAIRNIVCISISVTQMYSKFTYSVCISTSLSGAECNITVEWQGQLGCLSFSLCWTEI